MNWNIPGCTDIRTDGLTLTANCFGQEKTIRYHESCEQIYYANGRLECLPKGPYLKVCKNVRITETGEINAECPKFVSYRPTADNWKGEQLTYYNGALQKS